MPDLWSQVAYSYPEPGTIRRAEFDTIWAAARTRTVRVGVCGDSQETYTANGHVWFEWINALAAATFGNLPETPLYGPSSAGGGAPPAFLVSQSNAGGTGAIGTGGLTQAMFPPQITPTLHDSVTLGALYMLGHDNPQGARYAGLNFSAMFDPTSVGIDVIAMRRNIDGGQVRVEVRPQNSSATAYHQPIVQTFDSTDPVLATAGTPEARLISFSGLNRNSLTYHQVQVRGTGTTGVFTAIAAVRFKNLANPAGVVFSSMSAGGYRADNWPTTHGSADTFLRACGYDVFMIGMGINDAIGAGLSPATFKANILNMMAILRAANANARFVLRVDTHLYSTSGYMADFNQYAGVLKEIADTDQRVLVLNTRRRMDLLGHNDTNESVLGMTNKGLWTASTAYVVNDVVNISLSTTFPVLYVCTANHTSGATWATDGPGSGTTNGHQRWRRLRYIGRDFSDSSHHSNIGQMTIAVTDAIGLFGATTTLRTTPNWPRRMGRLDHRF